MSNLEVEGLNGLAGGPDDLSGGDFDLDGLAGPEIANTALNKLDKLVKVEQLGKKAQNWLRQVRNALALNRTYVQHWKAKYDQATSPSEINAALLKAAEKQIVSLRAQGATD